jgi:hypothetical protein
VQDISANGYPHTVLNAPEGWGKFTVAVPKGWGSATSFTYKIYWMVTANFTPGNNLNSFLIGQRGWSEGGVISTPFCSSTCQMSANSPAKDILKITSGTITNSSVFAVSEGQLMQMEFGRIFESTIDVNVYVFGVQVTANS